MASFALLEIARPSRSENRTTPNCRRKKARALVGALLALAITPLTLSRAAGLDSPLLAPHAQVEKVCDGFEHAEGPLWDPKGYLLFCDTPRDRIVKWEAPDRITNYLQPCGRATGLCLDLQGRLVANESHGGPEGRRRVSRRETDGTWHVLAERYEGKRLNSPNDLTIDPHGRIFFTDPRYSKRETMELTHESVYRIDPDEKLTRLELPVVRPNGILVTPDARTLYVADNPTSGTDLAALWAFDLDAAGTPSGGRAIFRFKGNVGIDGMTLDRAGRIWAAAGRGAEAGIYVFTPDRERDQAVLTLMIPLPATPTNCTFGGAKRDTLFVLSDTTLYRIRTTGTGLPLPPGK